MEVKTDKNASQILISKFECSFLSIYLTDLGHQIRFFETLRNILDPFAGHVIDDGGKFYLANDRKRFPDYKINWYKLVDDKIQEQNLSKPVMFTWLTAERREEAIADLQKHPMPDIIKIDEPH